MNKISLSFALIVISSSVFAQDGYYIKGGLGTGTSSSSFLRIDRDGYNRSTVISSEQVQLNIGYDHKNLQLETGIDYLLTGISFNKRYGEQLCGASPEFVNKETPMPVPLPKPDIKYTIRNPHLIIPFIVSYSMNRDRRLSFNPGIGLEAAFNFKGMVSASAPDADNVKQQINYKYNVVSAMVLFKFDIQYRIDNQWSIWVCPSYQNMLTSITTKVDGDYMSRQYDHARLINGGVKYNLHPQKQHIAVHTPKS